MKALFVLLVFLILGSGASAEPGGVSEVGWSAGGRYLVTAGGDRRLRVHDGLTGKVLTAVRIPGESTYEFSFSPDSSITKSNDLETLAVSGDVALTATSDGSLRWWSLPTLENVRVASTDSGFVGATLAGAGKVAAVVETSTRYLTSDMTLTRWSADGVDTTSFPDLPSADSSESYGVPVLSPSGEWAAAWTGASSRLWNLGADPVGSRDIGDRRVALLGSKHYFLNLVDEVVMYGFDDRDESSRRFACSQIRSLAVDERESLLVALGREGLRVWDLKHPETRPVLWSKKADAMTLSPDGRLIALWQKNAVQVCELSSRTFLYQLPRRSNLR